MAKKNIKPSSGNKRPARTDMFVAAKVSVTFPQPGSQNCFGTKGTPFIAFGARTGLGSSVIVGAEIILPDGSSLVGTAMTDDQFANDGTHLTSTDPVDLTSHIRIGDPTDVWAFVFPTITDGTAISAPSAFVVTSANVSGATETVIPFENEQAMNQHSEKSLHHPIIGSFEPLEDLLYHDCPYVFTFRDAEMRLAIAYLSAMEKQFSQYLAVPIEEVVLNELKAGSLPLRRVFRDWAWDITVDGNANIISVRHRSIQELGPNDLPPADLCL